MTIEHKNLTDPNLHDIKGFAGANPNTVPTKNSSGNLEYVDLDTLGGNPLDHNLRHLPNTGGDPLVTGTPVTIGTANAEGNSNDFARGNHVHAHGAQTDPSHHAVATPTTAGFMSGADKTKLDSLAELTPTTVKSLYESNTNTNAFTDAEKTKLAGIEDGATGDQTASEIKLAYESNANTNEYSDAEKTKLAGIEAGAEVNQSDAEIKTQYENNADTNAFTDAEKTLLSKLDIGWLQYGNSATQTTTALYPATTNVLFQTDVDSFSNGFLTKTNNTTFRADFTGFVEVDFSINARNTANNDRRFVFVIKKNGTAIPRTLIVGGSRQDLDERMGSFGRFFIPVVPNDTIQLGFAALTAADNIRIPANEASMRVKVLRRN